jgi:hypothetical protein
MLITREGKTDGLQKRDIESNELLGTILGAGTFCAGTIVLNLDKFRRVITKGSVDKYIESLEKKFPDEACLYMGDQGLASAFFAGEIEYFLQKDNPELWYRPNNFPVGYFYEHEKEDFKHRINAIHFNAGLTYKPWVARFDVNEIAKYDLRVNGAAGHAPYMATPTVIGFNEMWWEFCRETPIYDEVNYRAEIAADVLQKYFLPLCNDYNKLFIKHEELEQKNNDLNQCISSLLNQFPLLNDLSPASVSFLKPIINAVFRDDIQSALDEVLHMGDNEIPDEHAESYLTLAQHICAAAEYADGWLLFKKEFARFLLDSGLRERAANEIKELEDLLPDDEEVKALRKKLDVKK